jgi:hypothetical protein
MPLRHAVAELVVEKLVLKDFGTYTKLVADAYAKAPTHEPSALPHWKALQQSTQKLFKRISSKVKVEFVDENPYADADDMRQQVKNTGTLKIWRGESDHSVFGQADNLKFRAVHDYITHIVAGMPFGARGEIRAYNVHAKLAPPEAVPALFTEVVGQACTAVATGSFPAQKIALLRGFDYYHIGAVDGYDVKNKELVKQEPAQQEPQAPKPQVQAPAAKPQQPAEPQLQPQG